jgi:hypothetical protein
MLSEQHIKIEVSIAVTWRSIIPVKKGEESFLNQRE